MISTYSHQKELSKERLEIKSSEQQFINIVTNGTNCSNFESEIVLREAKKTFGIGEYKDSNSLQPGQLIWIAVGQSEPAGKKISECEMKRIVLTYINHKEDAEVQKKFETSAMRRQQICRLTVEALEQGALLTQEDLSKILGTDVRTIRRDIQVLKCKGISVATRGQHKDIGPGVTHREKAVTQYLEGKQALDISRDLHHSLCSIERYVDTFCRVVFCQNKFKDTLHTALVVGISISAVNNYLQIYQNFKSKNLNVEILSEIEEKGSVYWENCDFKKKSGLQKRRNR